MLKRLLTALLAVLLCLPTPALAFPTPFSLGNGSSSANSATVTLTTSTDAEAGDYVVVLVVYAHASSTINSVSDSIGGNTYTGLTQLTPGGSLGRMRTFRSRLKNRLPAGTVITATMQTSSTSYKQVSAMVVRGANAVDKTLTGASGTSNSPALTLGTLTHPNEVVVLALTTVTTITTPVTEPTGYAYGVRQGSTFTTQLSYREVSSTADDTPTYGLSASVAWGVQAISFASIPNGLMLTGVGN